jgi:hypothetical protein
MRGLIDSKSDTCTESMEVNAAGISVKVSVHYPGRSVALLRKKKAAAVGMRPLGVTEVSRGHIKAPRPCRRAERKEEVIVLEFR